MDSSPNRGKLRLGVLLLNGFQLSTIANLVDTIEAAARFLDRRVCHVNMMTPTGEPARSASGYDFPVRQALLWPAEIDYLVVVGNITGHMWKRSNTVQRYLQAATEMGVTLVGIESGIFTLARLGFLDGHASCIATGDLSKIEDYPKVNFSSDQIIVQDRNRITSIGGIVASDLAAYLISMCFGSASGRKSCVSIGWNGPRHPTSYQPREQLLHRGGSPQVVQAISIMEQNIETLMSLEELALNLNLSRRQLDRKFILETGKSPREIYLSIRLEEAVVLLQSTKFPITGIALATGFADSAHFTNTVKKVLKRTPQKIRNEI